MREKFNVMWSIRPTTKEEWRAEKANHRTVEINGEQYLMSESLAGITHALLLLIEEIRDK